MSQKSSEVNKKRSYFLPKLLIFIALMGSGFWSWQTFKNYSGQVCRPTSFDEQALSKRHASLESQLNALQEKLETLEAQRIECPSQAPVRAQDMRPLFLFQSLMNAYFAGYPFSDYLESLMALPDSIISQTEDLNWLIDYGKKGTPTVHQLIAWMDTPSKKGETSVVEKVSFWKKPGAYLKGLFDWKKIVTVEKNQEKEDQEILYTLLISKDFLKAHAFVSASKIPLDKLQNALRDLIRSRKILRHIEGTLLQHLEKSHES